MEDVMVTWILLLEVMNQKFVDSLSCSQIVQSLQEIKASSLFYCFFWHIKFSHT